MIDHVSIAVSDLERADAFYTAVFAALGLARRRAEERRVGYGKAYAEFWINFRGGAHDEGDGRHVAFARRASMPSMPFTGSRSRMVVGTTANPGSATGASGRIFTMPPSSATPTATVSRP